MILASIFSLAIAADDKVLLIGDSLAYMLAPYIQTIAKEKNIPFVSVAKGGSTLAQWYGQRWAKIAVKQHKPTIVLVSLGTNDLVPQNKEMFAYRAERLTSYVEHQGIRIIWLIPPPMPFSVKFAWDALNQLEVESFNSNCIKLDREADKIHLTYWANRSWANLIWQYLETGLQNCES